MFNLPRSHIQRLLLGKPSTIASTRTAARCTSSLSPTIRQLLARPPELNSEGTARGHIKAVRQFRNIGFVDLSDGSIHQTLSVIFSHPEADFSTHTFKVGQSVEISGTWIESKGVQPFELQYDSENPAHSIALLGNVPDTYPIQKKKMTVQYLRTLPTLRHRTSLLASVLRFRSRVEKLLGDFLSENDVVKVAPPLITSSDCEGAGEQFQIAPMAKLQQMIAESTKARDAETAAADKKSFFGKDAYMTVSTQLHLEVLALSLNRAYTLTPCFRAEDSNTNRHLSEFWMLEAELCYVTEIRQLTDFVEAMVRNLVCELQKDKEHPLVAGALADLTGARFSKAEKQSMAQVWDQIASDQPWPSITYTEALEILNREKYLGKKKRVLSWGSSISTEDEKWLAGTHYKSPVFVTDYPKAQKPFYMLQNEARAAPAPAPGTDSTTGREGAEVRETVACFDLIVPEIGELVGGSLREHDYEKLVGEMERRGMSADAMEWYMSTRENGSIPHGGFGLGFERLLAYLAAVENIRDISAFPRAPNVCAC